MSLQHDELAILTARCGAERCGASRCGFVPKDMSNEQGTTASGPFYMWKEQKQDADGTTYTVVRE